MPDAPSFARLEDWLDWQQRLHPTTIDLGLERVARVLVRTGWRRPRIPVITVGGTNGKGSTVALIATILHAHGKRVGAFTSPHLVDYRERIRIDGSMVEAASLVAAFERIAAALDDDSLTYFEFNALAALLVFEQAPLDAIVLEVGLGGRLDAVNVVDADVAVVVSVALDHMDWLGPDEETIGREKAGIFRAGKPAIYGARDPPASLVDAAALVGAHLHVRGQAYDGRPAVESADAWDYVVDGRVHHGALPVPALAGSIQVANAATALYAITATARWRLERSCIESGLRSVRLPGRLQRVQDARGLEWVFDVAHNPAAAATLARHLEQHPVAGRTLAVCGMLGDKDVPGVVAALAEIVDAWFGATPEGPRALEAAELAARAATAGVKLRPVGAVATALEVAAAEARAGDRIVVFGSFHTVGPALVALSIPL